MPPTVDPKTVATTYLDAWTSGDFASARSLIWDDLIFVGPLGQTEGAEEAINGLKGMKKIVKSVEPKKSIVEGNDVCLIYDLITIPAGSVPTAAWYHIRDGKIGAIRAYFDARPLVNAQG